MEYTLSAHAEWIALTLSAPTATESDPDDPTLTHALRVIPEFGGRVLRVIYNRTKQPSNVVTAFFDRGMKGKL